MNEEEKKAIKKVKEIIYNPEYRNIILFDSEGFTSWHINFEIILNLIEKQQKEIAEQKERLDGRYYHSVKLRELEIAIEEDWRNKIRKLKEKVENEMISNPYDFSYMINELLGE